MKTKCLFVMFTLVAVVAMLTAQTGSLKQVGKAGDWINTIAGTGMGGKIYTIEKSGALYVTDPATGAWKQLGKPDFANTSFLFDAGGKLCTIEKDGSMYLVDPANGSWKQSGKAGDWKNTIAGAGQKGMIYTVENSGALYMTEPSTGIWTQVGKADFANTAFLFDVGGRLCVLTKDGSLYTVDPIRGIPKQSGKAGDWKNTVAGVGAGNRLYTVEGGGSLYETDPATGDWKPLGKPDFSNTQILFHCKGSLLTLDKSGNLYRVELGSGAAPVTAPAQPAASEAALAGDLTFKFMGSWKGDTAPLEKDPEFKKQLAANPEQTKKILQILQTTAMQVTLDGITVQALGQKSGPFPFVVVSSSGNTLAIEYTGGEKQGVKSSVTFIDARHIKFETDNGAKAMFFVK